MPEFLTIVHSCAAFSSWKMGYDADAANRAAAGLTDLLVLRRADDSNIVLLIFAVSNRDKAKAFIESEQLREAMTRAGVVGVPTIEFRDGNLKPEQAVNYLTLNCKISGIEKFRKGYAMDATERADAGLGDTALLQNVDDTNDLFLMWTVSDVGRADAFLKLSKLAEHQTRNAGIVGPPQAHFWTR